VREERRERATGDWRKEWGVEGGGNKGRWGN